MELEAIIREIEKADAMQTEALMDAVFERKQKLFPDWDICYIALPKGDWDVRENTLKSLLELEYRARKCSE